KNKTNTTAKGAAKGPAHMETDMHCDDCGTDCDHKDGSCSCESESHNCEGGGNDCGQCGCDCDTESCACNCCCGPDMQMQDPDTMLRDAATDVWMKLFMEQCEKEWKKAYGKDIAKAAKVAVKESKAYWEQAMPKKRKK
ncbi:MAG: hypothetical protein Q7R47_06545, partial [Candidatus Diapherotrites archaeon]|nr:hypothetical protein [Candidatus Diapherotrites archaeon]